MAERRVLLEVKVDRDAAPDAAHRLARNWLQYGFEVDPEYRAVPLRPADASGQATVIVRGTLREGAREDALRRRPQIVRMWEDAPLRRTGMV